MLKTQKDKFYLPDNVTYLNCAYMSPLLKEAHEVGQTTLRQKCLPYEVSINHFFEPMQRLKIAYSNLINANDPERIAIISSTSYGLANVANNVQLQSHQHILLAAEQFPSNVYVWQRLAEKNGAKIQTISPPIDSKNRAKQWNLKILEAINKDTKLVALGHVHWADGTLFDLQKIRERTYEVGALLVIDGTQSLGALPFDVQKIKPDALIASTYKWLMGPYGFGLAYYGEHFDHGVPIEENWINRKDSHIFSNLVNYQSAYQPKAGRYSVGEQSNFVYVAMQLAAINQLNEWGVHNVNKYCQDLMQEPINILKSKGCIIEDLEWTSPHLLGVRLPSFIDLDDLKQQFENKNIHVSIRGNSIRLAPNVYNDHNDVDRFLACF